MDEGKVVRPRLRVVSVAKSLNPTGFWMVIFFFVKALLGIFLGYWILACILALLGDDTR
jgi:hypothetical protein